MAQQRGKNPGSAKTHFKKGQVANPHGSRAHDPVFKAFKKLTKRELADIGELVFKQNITAVEELAASKTAPALHVCVAEVIRRVAKNGDMGALDTLLNRLIGKVKDEVQMSGELNSPQVIVTLPSNGREAK